MADSLNPIDIEQSLADFDAAYPDAFVTKKQNALWIGPLPMSAVHVLRRHTAELGNAIDNVVRGLVDKYTAVKHTGSTTDATPTTIGSALAIPSTGTLHVEAKIWGKKTNNDMVYIKIETRLEDLDGAIVQYVDSSLTQYSNGGTLSTATAVLVVGTGLDVKVTGEAATSITWEGYTIKREVSFS